MWSASFSDARINPVNRVGTHVSTTRETMGYFQKLPAHDPQDFDPVFATVKCILRSCRLRARGRSSPGRIEQTVAQSKHTHEQVRQPALLAALFSDRGTFDGPVERTAARCYDVLSGRQFRPLVAAPEYRDSRTADQLQNTENQRFSRPETGRENPQSSSPKRPRMPSSSSRLL